MVLDVISIGEPADPLGWARLFPNAAIDDLGEAHRIDDHIGTTIRGRKRDAAVTTASTAFERRLSSEQTLAWLIDVNDARLVLAARIGANEDILSSAYQPPPEHLTLWESYVVLSVVLEELVRAVDRD